MFCTCVSNILYKYNYSDKSYEESQNLSKSYLRHYNILDGIKDNRW